MEPVATPRALVDPRVLFSWAMARLAGHAEFRRGCVRVKRVYRLSSERRIESGSSVRRVARDAHGIPRARFALGRLTRGAHDGRTPRNPAMLLQQPNGWQLSEH